MNRQTISNWETDETLPDICRSRKLTLLYYLSLDELIELDIDLREIEQVIEHTSGETEKKVGWTKVWGKKYPILITYQNEVDISEYTPKPREMLDDLKKSYGCNDVDTGLVLRDILAQVWKQKKNRQVNVWATYRLSFYDSDNQYIKIADPCVLIFQPATNEKTS